MTTDADIEFLASACREASLGWYADWVAKHEDCANQAKQLLMSFDCEYQRRFSIHNSFIDLAKRLNSTQRKALLQALVSGCSSPILVMVYRILLGAQIKQIDLNYKSQDYCQLTVILNDANNPRYESKNIHDATVLRHFGILTINDNPIFDGFYALNLKD